ncbi:MAG: molybdopterin converting factor subunit 1 [Rhizobiaceae bacterium]|nr:molybdopterin converting factor subunit 1 [Rhizobiaceae bacterium]
MKLVYFAWLRERLGVNEEMVDLPDDVQTIADLFGWLKQREEPYADVFEASDIIQVAIGKQHVLDRSTNIAGADEIALFPPMTGG